MVRDHLANERTLLAWLRTALTVIGLGFIVDRLAAESGQQDLLSGLAGIGLVFLGAVVALGGAYSYVNTRRGILTGTVRSNLWLHLGSVALVVVAAALITAYLVWAG